MSPLYLFGFLRVGAVGHQGAHGEVMTTTPINNNFAYIILDFSSYLEKIAPLTNLNLLELNTQHCFHNKCNTLFEITIGVLLFFKGILVLLQISKFFYFSFTSGIILSFFSNQHCSIVGTLFGDVAMSQVLEAYNSTTIGCRANRRSCRCRRFVLLTWY